MLAPAPKARRAGSLARRLGRFGGGFDVRSLSPGLVARLAAHGLVLSLALAALPYALAPTIPAPIEDVGAVQAEVTPEDSAPDLTQTLSEPLEQLPLLGPFQVSPPDDEKLPLRLRNYTVREGDTLSIIAKRFEVTTTTLVWANELADPNLLLVGEKLVIPPLPGVLHRVRPGDTLADLASYYGSDLPKAIEVNGLEPPYVILVGQRLLLPGGRMPALPSRSEPSAPNDTAPARPETPRDAQTPRDSSSVAARLESSAPAAKPLPQPTGATPEQARFILTAAEAARESQRETGVPASVSIAQAILESFWGSSKLSRENNNYFGIKARERPGSAGVVWYNVWEVVNGQNVTQNEPFRAYKTAADSFVDHGRFFIQNPRYAAALAARKDPKQFAREINRAGYATDPAYSVKLIGLMERFNLYQYDLE